MTWQVLIVDDEPLAREELAYTIGQVPKLKLAGEASSGMEAIKKAKDLKVDFVFLDIQLPDLTGLQVAELLRELQLDTEIVFVTAYDQYAVEAFKHRAFHYILKPYDTEDFVQMVNSYERSLNRKKAPAAVASDYKPRLAVETGDEVIYLPPGEIVYIAKEGRAVSIYTLKNKYEAHYTLQQLEEKLQSYSFFRTHKSYLVNLDYVKELRHWFNGAVNLHLNDQNGTVVPVSRNYVKELRLKLEL